MKIASTIRVVLCISVLTASFLSIYAQSDKELGEATIKALTYYQQQRFAEAIPQFEIILKALPESQGALVMYGRCLLFQSKQTKDTGEAKRLSAKALEQFVKAKQVGLDSAENDALIALLSGKAVPSEEGPTFSLNKEADKLMVEGENYFAQSKYDDAIKKFEKALALDPTIYRAALSGGDSYVAKSDWAKAEEWYQRAIVIAPDRETAYRYSATPFMRQEKYDQARDRYIEAYITEPYSNMSRRGIAQWAGVTGAKLGHPLIDIPEVSFDVAGKAVAKPAIDASDPSARPWLAYLAVRELWKKEKFAKAFPKEQAYRHSLAEEAEALRAALADAAERKTSNSQLQVLSKIEADGLLEAFILMAKPDDGIIVDHAKFLTSDRQKLRQYVASYVIHK